MRAAPPPTVPYGSRAAAHGVQPAHRHRRARPGRARTSTAVGDRPAVARGDQWASTSRYTNNATGNTTRVTQGSGGGAAVTRNTPGPGGGGVAQTGSGDVYAGRDGNVYKKEAGGGWSEANGGARPDTSTAGQLNRDSAARAEGAQRTRDYSSSSGGGREIELPPERRRRDVARRRRRRTTAIANTETQT